MMMFPEISIFLEYPQVMVEPCGRSCNDDVSVHIFEREDDFGELQAILRYFLGDA
jgi:hypothetical protein